MSTMNTDPGSSAVDMQTSMFDLAPPPQTKTSATKAKPRVRLRLVHQTSLGLSPDLDPWLASARELQPKTRGECSVRGQFGGACPWVSCVYHLYSDEFEDDRVVDDGRNLPPLMVQFERMIRDLAPEDWGDTCSLDVADRVEVRASERGMYVGHTVVQDEQVAHLPPIPIDDGREWMAPAHDRPMIMDLSIVGQLLGGFSREQMRKDRNTGAAKMRKDPVMAEHAENLAISWGGRVGDGGGGGAE